ncbi:hypothetical protein FANTH_14611 [Fusarium anthophilum]|uniref:Uncharacterized protein n=1 Tax=Fusarium anthophilum TaxID=48485 RepID=A0A8H5DLI9_9HYPO|nr:hypothetical protein FANTH_14611 [Fusarium anthophilum]
MNSTQVPAIPESSGDLHPNKMKTVVLTINLLSLKLSSANYLAAFRPLLQELERGLLHCAANARDGIYLQLGAQLQEKDPSEERLENDLFILLEEKKTPCGERFYPLFDAEPDQDSNDETVLRALNHQLKLGIDDCSKDIYYKLIATCSIGLSQLGRRIVYEPKTSLVNYCWRVNKRLKDFPKSWSSSSRLICPPFAQPPQEAAMDRRLTQLEEDLEDLKIEFKAQDELRAQDVKNSLNLNVRVDNVSDGQFNNKTGDEILLRIEGIERKLDAIMGRVEPLRSPADGNGLYTFIPESK